MTNVEKFIADTRKTARVNGITIKLEKKEYVDNGFDDLETYGYFDSDRKILAVATEGPKQEWLGIFVHESCHMDQFLTDRYLWDKCDPAHTIFSNWLTRKTIVKREVLEECIQDIIRIELDCELRSIAKIKKYDLPIDLRSYKQTVNMSLYGYLYFLDKKAWIPSIFETETALKVVPSRLRKKYDKIPQRLRRAFDQGYKAIVD